MAEVYLFNSAATLNARLSLKADNVTGVKEIEIRDAANIKKRSVVLTPALEQVLLDAWRRNEQSVVTLDGTAGVNVFVSFSGFNSGSSWPNSEEADEDTQSDHIDLNGAETAIVMGWIDQYTP